MTIRRAVLVSAWVIASQLACAQTAAAHGGGLNAEGCHNDRKNGGYHCHRGSAARQPLTNDAPVPKVKAPKANQLTRDQSGRTHYANCSAARAAGAAPVRRGDPGYGAHLDRDNDGVGCE